MEILLKDLIEFTRLPEDSVKPTLKYFYPVNVPSKTLILLPGTIATTAWFISSGCLRSYYQMEEKKRSKNCNDKQIREITDWIVPSGGFLTDISSFLNQTPTFRYIESLQPSRIYGISLCNYNQLNIICTDVMKRIFEHSLLMADQRVQINNLRYPADRLEMFEKLYPKLSSTLSVNVQASYLNIDPTTLSKIRSKRR